ncbi:PH domain-containing protein [Iamia majanohamensis]|uniref:PH domain-containing protein n=1 Tax=Iamia majanohamensis TaxID=467976 RepID=A0AAF0BR09_9ACTN|nr:PH domain-containing protein [Iamia majanohamensis]WCO65751.1 PH domain-containing protein [Iamia majanohamensis]
MRTDDPKLTGNVTDHLDPGESIVHVVAGRYVTHVRRPRAYLVATERRLIFVGIKFAGQHVMSFYYGQVDAFGHSKGVLGASLAVSAGNASCKVDRIKDPDLAGLEQFVRGQMRTA